MAAIQLTPAQRKVHRSQAHHLDPVVMIGTDGLTESVAKELDAALTAHGLIKVRIASDDRAYRNDLLVRLSSDLNAAPIQHIGKLLILWRPVQDRAKPDAPARKAAPREVKIVRFSKSGNHRPQIKRITLLGNQRVAAGGEVKRAKRRSASVKKGSHQP